MKTTRARNLIAAVLTGALMLTNAHAQNFTTEELQQRMVERRAVDAAIWGIPIVSLDTMRQAYFRDGKAKYGDIIWWPKGNAWKNQSLTPNTSLRYLYVFFNTKYDGPVVLDLPSAANGASLLGTIADAWQVPLTDVGFEGKGGKYLVLPPDYTGEVPAGYIAVRSKTYNTFTTIRSILASNSEEDERKGDALVKQIKTYPLANAGNPPAQRFIDMTDIMYDGLVHYDESLYTSLARMLNEEPVQPQDLQMMGMLLPLGIEKGKDFKPDATTVAQLKSAAAEAHAWLLASSPRSSRTGGPVASGKCRPRRLPHRQDSSGRSPTISTLIRAALASPASSCLPRSSALGASTSARTSTVAVNRCGARTLIDCTFPRMFP